MGHCRRRVGPPPDWCRRLLGSARLGTHRLHGRRPLRGVAPRHRRRLSTSRTDSTRHAALAAARGWSGGALTALAAHRTPASRASTGLVSTGRQRPPIRRPADDQYRGRVAGRRASAGRRSARRLPTRHRTPTTTTTRRVPQRQPTPSTVHRPLSAVHCPLSTVHRPPSTVHRPPSTVHRPPSTVHRPLLSTVLRPPSIVHRPPSFVHCPPSTVHRPPSTVHRPPSTVHRPPFTVHCPPFTVHRSTSTIHRSPDLLPLDDKSSWLVEPNFLAALAPVRDLSSLPGW